LLIRQQFVHKNLIVDKSTSQDRNTSVDMGLVNGDTKMNAVHVDRSMFHEQNFKRVFLKIAKPEVTQCFHAALQLRST